MGKVCSFETGKIRKWRKLKKALIIEETLSQSLKEVGFFAIDISFVQYLSLTRSFLKYPFLNHLLMVVIDGRVQGIHSFCCDGFVCLSVCKGNVKPDPWESGP